MDRTSRPIRSARSPRLRLQGLAKKVKLARRGEPGAVRPAKTLTPDASAGRVSVVPAKIKPPRSPGRARGEGVPRGGRPQTEVLAGEPRNLSAPMAFHLPSTTRRFSSMDISSAVEIRSAFSTLHWRTRPIHPIGELSPAAPPIRGHARARDARRIGQGAVGAAATHGYLVPRIHGVAMKKPRGWWRKGVATRGIDRPSNTVSAFAMLTMASWEFIDWARRILFMPALSDARVRSDRYARPR